MVDSNEENGFNPVIFDAAIPTAAQVNRGGAGRRVYQSRRLFCLWAMEQKKQLKVNDNVRLKVADKKSEAQLRAREKVQSALSKFEFDSKSMYDKDSGYVIRWVLPQVKVDFLLKDLKKRKDILAKLANPPSNWTTYKPRREALSAATTTTTTATVK